MNDFVRQYGPLIGLIGGLTGIWTWAVNEWNRRPRLSLNIRNDADWSYVELNPSGHHSVLTVLITNKSSVPNAILSYELASKKKDNDKFDFFRIEQGEMSFEEDGAVTVRHIGVIPLNLPPKTVTAAHLWAAINANDYPDPIVFDLRVTDMWGNTFSGSIALKKGRRKNHRLRPGETSVES